jgi:hypothetical protein
MMTPEQQTLADVKAEIEKLTPEQRAAVMRHYHTFRELTIAGGALAAIAIALIGAEMAAME